MRRLLTLALLLVGFATAQTPENENPELTESKSPSVTESVTNGGFGVTLTCQAAAPRVAVLCSVERSVWSLAGFAVTVGVEARAALYQPIDGHLAGYVTLSYATADGRAYYWLDVRTPKVAPAIGTSDVVRLGFSIQIGGNP